MSELLHRYTSQVQELLARLKKISVLETEVGTSPASFSMAVVACRLLASRGRQEGNTSLATWLQSIGDVLEWLQLHPLVLPAHQHSFLNEVSGTMERVLHGLDAGKTLAALTGADFVSEQQRTLLALGEVILPKVPNTVDGLPDLRPDARPADDLRRVLLVVGGFLRAGQLRRRLRDGGLDVVECSEISEAIVQLEQKRSFAAVLCDNVEPGPHLRAMAAAFEFLPVSARSPLILITGSDSRRMVRYARFLGADTCWGPPFSVEVLRPYLARGRRVTTGWRG